MQPEQRECQSSACRYVSGGYCCDRILSTTPNGSRSVAVVGLLRTANASMIWKLFTNPVISLFVNWRLRATGQATTTPPPFDELPAWWRALPDGKLRGAEKYRE